MNANQVAEFAKIKDRIAKLLRMSKDSSSPEEAAIAMGRARKLMDAHQISEFEAGAVTEQFLTMKGTMSLKKFPKYMEHLAVRTCQLNDCQAVYAWGNHAVDDSMAKHIDFRGYTSDVQMAVDMYNSLLATCQKLAVVFLKENGYEPNDYRMSGIFKEGAVTAINLQMSTILAERKKLAASAGTSLVIRKMEEVVKKFGAPNYTNSKTRRLSREEEGAYSNGYVQGAKVEVRRSVGQ